MSNDLDIIVVGGGHAGLEAAWIAAQFDLQIGLISLSSVPLGDMPCNPAVGGVGKGQVVREIDSLGGLMGRLTDKVAIQCRILNESKGFAVQSTRMQVDKNLYSDLALEYITSVSNINLISEQVVSIKKSNGRYLLQTSESGAYSCSKLIITTGTFLNGLLHCGDQSTVGGVIDKESSLPLHKLFSSIPFKTNRFKTGTPPRLKLSTIDFSVMEEQASDPNTRNFHWSGDTTKRLSKQISCHMTHTTLETMTKIRDNRDRSPLFNGKIKGVGPRYCPSIEDKAFRYPDRNSHHVFVEPEGLTTESVYPNGLSTSLPKDIQEAYIHSIPGLEKAEFLEYGYAVEYDVIDTSLLMRSLEHTDSPGLFFAGQVNGTSGYEEAAGQGLIAGINAALSFLKREPLIIDRNDSYIGVLVEDLVSNVRDEPYRLFTARSENRLYIREDNVINRMYSYRKSLLLVGDIDHYQKHYLDEFNLLSSLVDSYVYKANEKTKKYFTENGYGPMVANVTLCELICRSKLNPVNVLRREISHFKAFFDERVVYACAISKKYKGYINRANQETAKLRKLDKKAIIWKDLYNCENISNECRQRIEAVRPETFGQLQRIDGIRPATLAFVAGSFL